MEKRNTLVSLLAIPLISTMLFLSGCRMPDMINPPYQKPIEFSFIDKGGKKTTLKSYYHKFSESHTGSQVIEIKGIESKKYVGTGRITVPEVDYFNGKSINFYSPEKQEKINCDYLDCLKLVNRYQQEKRNTAKMKIRQMFQEKATRRVEEELQNN